MYIKLGLKDPRLPSKLPPKIEKMIIDAIRAGRIGIGMDYDRTMVKTDEKGRVFPPFAVDTSRVIEPTGGILMQGIPLAILTGNKPSYIDTLCIEGLRAWLEVKRHVGAMQHLSVYSQNSTWFQVYDAYGQENAEATNRYAERYTFPPEHIQAIERAFLLPLQSNIGPDFMSEKPLVIRPAGTREIHHAFAPIFESRGGVSLSWIAVPGEVREQVILAALQQLDQTIAKAYRFEPGGQFSIDINHRRVAKHIGARHFIREQGLSLLLYFGDSVYKKGKHIGNDLPVVRAKEALVFAVNPDQSEIPEHERIIKAGVGPDATRAWLTWFLLTYVSLRLSEENLSTPQKIALVDSLVQSGFVDDISIT